MSDTPPGEKKRTFFVYGNNDIEEVAPYEFKPKKLPLLGWKRFLIVLGVFSIIVLAITIPLLVMFPPLQVKIGNNIGTSQANNTNGNNNSGIDNADSNHFLSYILIYKVYNVRPGSTYTIKSAANNQFLFACPACYTTGQCATHGLVS
jgi:hypothetical protein